MKSFAIVLIFLWVVASCEAPQSPEVVYYIDFEEDRHLEAFVPETEVNSDEVTVKEGYLDIDAVKGATVWFREKLYAPIKIEYTAVVVEEGGPNDRVSDLNCFFMAIDPRCPANVFDCADSVRTGRFPTYHDLRSYYVGFGGNNNGTTRMRRYPGYTRERPMLPEHDLKSPLIVPNQPIKVEITVEGNGISYAHDGTVIFEMEDELPYHEGWFAFRTVRNHLRIMDFSVTALD